MRPQNKDENAIPVGHQYKVEFSICKGPGIFFKAIITVLRLTFLGCLWSGKREVITFNCDAEQRPNLATLICLVEESFSPLRMK